MSLDTLDSDIRDSVKEAARRAGMSVEEWVAATISNRAQRMIEQPSVRRRAPAQAHPHAHAPAHVHLAQPVDELDAVAAKISRLARGRTGQPRDRDTLLATASAETDRRARENAAKTAVALDAVARWIEQAESRLDQTTRATAERQERTQAVLGEALGLMTRRLEDIERKFETSTPPALEKALKAIERVEAQVARTATERAGAPSEVEAALRSFEERIAGITERIAAGPRPMGRRGLTARDELKTAVAEIRQRKAELDEPEAAPSRRGLPPEPAAPAVTSSALDALRADIARLAGQIDTPQAPQRDEAAAAALRQEMGELQRALGTLATRGEIATLEEAVRDLTRLVMHARQEGGDVAAVTAPIAELQAEVRRLSEVVTAGVHGRLAADLEGVARRLDSLGTDPAGAPELVRQFGELRGVLADIAEPHRIAGLSEQVSELTRHVQQIGRSQVDAIEFASLRAAVDEIRAHMRAAPRDAAVQSAGAREIAELSAKLDRLSERLPEGDVEAFARMVETLSAKIDDVSAAARSTDLSAFGRRLDEIAARLADGPSPVGDQIKALSERVDTALLTRGDPAQIAPLMDRLDRLDESLRRPGPDLGPLEDMLRQLASRLDGIGRGGGDPDGLDALERQVATIASRLDGAGGADTTLSALQRTMGDLMAQVEGMRHETHGLAERAARTAVASTLESVPGGSPDLSGFRRDLEDIKALHGASDRRNRDTLEAVHSTLERLVDRLAALETDARPRGKAPAPARAASMPEATAALAQDAIRKIDAAAKAQGAPPFPLAEADRPLPPPGPADEILLEPGARPNPADLPKTGAQAASEMKATLIAQARRAAQAAAAETAAAKGRPGKAIDMAALAAAVGSGDKTAGLAARLRQAIDKRRRPLLLGLAAIVLALGTIQVVSGFMSAPKRPATIVATPSRLEAPALPPGPANAIREVPARDVLAAPAPAEAKPADPPPEGARDRGASLATPRAVAADARPADPKPPEPARAAEARAPETKPAETRAPETKASDPAPAVTGALPSAEAPRDAAPDALGPIPNMASIGEIPASAGPAGLRQAALAGDPAAVYELASRAAEGRGMMRDMRLAARLFERAAAHGLVPAQFRIANHYEKGLGLPRDTALAKAWYQRAAEKGNARAMHNLAVLLAEGAGAKPDYTAAVEWFRRAAEHGVRDSQFNLAVLMARGLGTRQDLPGAFTWFSVAARQGDEDAGKKRDEVAARLNASELALARAGAERWRPEIPPRLANEVTLPAHGWSEAPSAAAAPAKPTKKI